MHPSYLLLRLRQEIAHIEPSKLATPDQRAQQASVLLAKLRMPRTSFAIALVSRLMRDATA